MPRYWLLKTEPSTYSFSQFTRDGKTNWNGVRNFQARNFLKEMAIGDLALIYHSGDDKCVEGVARVIRTAYPDPDPEKSGEWFQVDLAHSATFKRTVPLKEIKSFPDLADLLLIKQSRLSCMPVSAKHFEILAKLGAQTK